MHEELDRMENISRADDDDDQEEEEEEEKRDKNEETQTMNDPVTGTNNHFIYIMA